MIINTNFLSSGFNSKDSLNPFIFYFPGCYKKNFNESKKICPICLSTSSIIKGRPNTCNHIFCYQCISVYGAEEALFAPYVEKNLFI